MNEELHKELSLVKEQLLQNISDFDDLSALTRSTQLRSLYSRITDIEPDQRAAFGKAVNDLKNELSELITKKDSDTDLQEPIDITAPFAANCEPAKRPALLSAAVGSQHPITAELEIISDIFMSMGFRVVQSREIDDDWHMFGSLNFPEGHPARDDYDTFMTEQLDKNGKPLIAPAHTSTMQNRVLRRFSGDLAEGKPIAVLIPGRVFRNEDIDTRHEHTFYQIEGIYVGLGVTIGNLISTINVFLESFYKTKIEIKTQPFYFPFTEPSFEFSISCPFCSKSGCQVCSYSGWIEILGCGMIHPNVLTAAGIDANLYQGFAWGCGVDRLVMWKHDVEDVRNFESAKLSFLRQFSPENYK